MKNRRIEVSLGKTLNMGQYESARIDIGLAADIDDGADLDESYRKLLMEVNKQLIVNAETIKGKENRQSGNRFRRSRP